MPITRRKLLAGTAGLALGNANIVDTAQAAEEQPRLISQDYATARLRFSTHLTRKGPSPDKPQTMTPPRGTRRVDYVSGQLLLAAWSSPNADPAAPRPGVVVLHGGNALWQGHWEIAEPYVRAGYVALMPAVRGENGLPGYFSGFYNEVSDVLASAEQLRDTPGVDASRLFLVGHSVGGTLALLVSMSTTMFRAAAAFSGNPDARRFFGRYPEDIRFDTSDPREFEMRSAASFATSFKCPMLMLHGSREYGSDAMIRLTYRRALDAGLKVKRGVIEGDHTSAIPAESAEALKWFAAV